MTRAAFRRGLACATSLGLLLFVTPAVAQDVATGAADRPGAPPAEAAAPRIVVIGDRAIVAALQDVPIERTYTSDELESYVDSTLGELIGDLRRANGDDDPALLVNGQPVRDLGDVANLPVEAMARIERLPRGAAQRVGGGGNQRAYNVVLRSQLAQVTLTGSRVMATEGGYGQWRGEAIGTLIRGQDRLNLTARIDDADGLFYSERPGFILVGDGTPYSASGNVVPAAGSQIDSQLSAAAGRTVTVVALPAGNARPTLSVLVPFANATSPSEQRANRTFRGPSRNYEVAAAGTKQIVPWAALSLNVNLRWNDNTGYNGLPSARFLLPASNAFTPFSVPVYLAFEDPSRPLTYRSHSRQVSLAATLNFDLGRWHATAVARLNDGDRDFVTQFAGPLGAAGTVGAGTNPFDGALSATIPIVQRASSGQTRLRQFDVDAQGPLLTLWAGPAQARFGGLLEHSSSETADTSGTPPTSQTLAQVRVGLTVPLTSRQSRFLPGFGDSDVSIDLARTDAGSAGTLDRHIYAFNWQPASWLRLSASDSAEEHAVSPALVSAPVYQIPNAPYFDPALNRTALVTLIYGGGANLRNDRASTKLFSLNLSPLNKYSLQASVDYSIIDYQNQIGSLPTATPAVVAAFPERFIRDGAGNLIVVDGRPVNIARQHTRQLRFGLGYIVAFDQGRMILPRPDNPGGVPRRVQPLLLTFNASHTVVLESRTQIRSGLPQVDLLQGGAVDLGGGQLRHSSSLSVGLARGSTGVRIEGRRRGVSYLQTGTLSSPERLVFSGLSTMDIKAFADLGQLFPDAKLARRARLTVGVSNVTGDREIVIDARGMTPLAYQPFYRDPVGRTVSVELRKAF